MSVQDEYEEVDPFEDEYDEVDPSEFDDEPDAEPRQTPVLTVVPPTPSVYDPLAYAKSVWRSLVRKGADGHVEFPDIVRQAFELLRAHYWAVEWGGEVLALRRTSIEQPDGGVLVRPSDSMLDDAAVDFLLAGHATPPSVTTLKNARQAWRGRPHHLAAAPWTRWGRSDDGALWWDSGREDGQAIRLDTTGWSIEPTPGCWFVRPPGLRALPLPERGGSIEDLWQYVNVDPEDRSLVVAWLLASMLPRFTDDAGMLYITGPAGSGKSTSMSVLSEAAGGEPNRKPKATGSARDLAAAASAGWVFTIDNVSSWSAEESDYLCMILTGMEIPLRKLYTTSDVTLVAVRRPAIATAIDVPVLREDLVRRMVPVPVKRLPANVPATRLLADWTSTQPKVFGALLDLMVQVEALGDPPAGTNLSTLAAWGRMAWALDQLMPPADGISTVDRCVQRRTQLNSDDVLDDPFWRFAAHRLDGKVFVGTLAAFIQLVGRPEDPLVDTKSWPSSRALPGRIERHHVGLTATGWKFEKQPSVSAVATGHAPTWVITPPPRPDNGHAPGCACPSCEVHHEDF